MPVNSRRRPATKQQPEKSRNKNKEKVVGLKKSKKQYKDTAPYSTKSIILCFLLLPICVGVSFYYWKNFSLSKEYQEAEKSLNQSSEKKNDAKLQAKNSNDKDFSKPPFDFQVNVQNKIVPSPILSETGSVLRKWKEIKPKKKIKGSSVKVYVMDNFLSSRECEGLMHAHESHVSQHRQHDPIVCFSDELTMLSYLGLAAVPWSKSVSAKDFLQGTRCLNESLSSNLEGKLPWSFGTSFYPGENKFSTTYDKYVEKYTGLQASNGGKFQITSYEQDVGYKIHTDCTEGNTDLRDRFATILVYLQDVPEGGETEFTKLGIKIRPQKGKALLWNNMNANGECDLTSYHKASPVLKGKKYILQRWYYYHSFQMLGVRNEPPRFPIRSHQLTPRVSCDKFQSGSCRWYDEWNYDHLVDVTFV